MRFLPGLDRWAAQAPWVAVVGLLAYAASVLAMYRTRDLPPRESPESPSDIGEPPGGNDRRPSAEFPRLVEEALRQLNSPAALSRCGLIARLSATLAAPHSNPGPLEQAQALRTLLVSAIDRLKPAEEAVRPAAPEALQYQILHEEYVLGRSTTSIIARLSIGESTFYRNRRLAVSAIARHLETQEEQASRRERPR